MLQGQLKLVKYPFTPIQGFYCVVKELIFTKNQDRTTSSIVISRKTITYVYPDNAHVNVTSGLHILEYDEDRNITNDLPVVNKFPIERLLWPSFQRGGISIDGKTLQTKVFFPLSFECFEKQGKELLRIEKGKMPYFQNQHLNFICNGEYPDFYAGHILLPE